MKPYPAYEPSGIEWLGDVPAHWSVLPGRACLSLKYSSNAGLLETHVLSLSYGRIVTRRVELNRGLLPASFETYQIVEKGDLICRPTDLQNDWDSLRFGLSFHRGIITSAYMRLITRKHMVREYGYRLLDAYDLKKVFYGLGSGLRQNLSWADFKYLPCLVPPLSEQRAIARYLDHMDRGIQRYIEAKERLIELLEEQKRAVINQAVTRGPDPDVPFKPSGVEWLGDVPAHWEVRRLKFLATKFGSGVTPRGGAAVYKEAGIPFLRSQNVHFDGLRLDGVARIDPELHDELSASHVLGGDVLLNITGASIGRTCVVPEGFEDGNVNQHVCIIRPRRDVISSAFLTAFLSTSFIQRRIRNELGGASREGLTLQSIRDFEVLVPPLDEQHRINDHIRERTSEVLIMGNRTLKQIELIKEYRTRLIADVVTGKLDVRDAAAGLEEDDDVDAVDYPGTEA